MSDSGVTAVYRGDELAAYGFGDPHPFGTDRHAAFFREFDQQARSNVEIRLPVAALPEVLEYFHTDAHVQRVRALSDAGSGWLDGGDTPVVAGIYQAALTVVGTVLAAVDAIMDKEITNAFVPIAGLHHAARDSAAGFCVFNDCAIAIEYLKRHYGLERIAYVDIDAHHGDGVFYGFESDPSVIFADIHEDGRHLYPGTGEPSETGLGEAKGSKLNLCLPPGAVDADFMGLLDQVEAHLRRFEPQFIVMQCGADSLAGDPITHLDLSAGAHRLTTRRLKALAGRFASGRLLATGGGGYNRRNIGLAWTAVVDELCAQS